MGTGKHPAYIRVLLAHVFEYLAVLFVVAAIIYPLWILFSKTDFGISDAIWAAIISSSLTAVFTVGLDRWLTRRKEVAAKKEDRYRKHCNALVELEHERIEFAGILNDNIFTLENFINMSRKGAVIPYNPQPLPRNLPLLRDLLDLRLINELADLYNEARKLNDDTCGVQKTVDELRLALVNGEKTQKELDFYLHRVNELADQAGIVILIAAKSLVEKNNNAAAHLRARLARDFPKTGGITKILMNELSQVSGEEVKLELSRVDQEIDERTKERDKELQKLYREIKKP